jgi:hypothetical protein
VESGWRLRPDVRIASSPLAAPAGASLTGSLEIFDNKTGTTQVLVPADIPFPMPQPLLVGGPLGVRAGQIARVSVVSLGTQPITVSTASCRPTPC